MHMKRGKEGFAAMTKEYVYAFICDNRYCVSICLFLYFVGFAAGLRYTNTEQTVTVTALLADLPNSLRATWMVWFWSFALTLCTYAGFVVMLLLAAIWLPAVLLWPAALLLRGVLAGVYMGIAVTAWPSPMSIWLLFLLLFENAVLIPAMLELSVIVGKQVLSRIRHLLRFSLPVVDMQTTVSRFSAMTVGLMPCIVIQGIVVPLALSLFC